MDFSNVINRNEPHQRTIIHIDMDCFYAQVEEIRDPTLRSRPLGIQQKNCVVTCNYLAREFGVNKLMAVEEAQRLCPTLTLVNGEDLTPYKQMSQRIFDALLTFTPLVEKLGFDENYLDVTAQVCDRIEKNQYEHFESSAIASSIFPKVEGHIYPENAELLQSCDCGCTQRLAVGTQIAKEIRLALHKQLNITCCAGISYNKLLAKLVGSQHKPNQQTVLCSNYADEFMRNLNSLHKVTGIGQKTESLLLESGIANITELQGCNMDSLRKKFGFETATKLKDLSFGKDVSSVRPSGKPKTIGLEDSCRPISVRRDVEDRFRLLLMRLVEQVAEDGRIPIAIKVILRKFDPQKKTSHRETKQVNILPSLFKSQTGTESGGQKVVLAEGAQEKLLKIILRLFERVVDLTKPFNITLIGLAFSKFQQRKLGSSSIANFLIKKTDLEVQSITSLTNTDVATSSENPTASMPSPNNDEAFRSSPTTFQPSDQFYRRRGTAASPIPMLIDNGSESAATNSDFSDFSETEIEPSPKKSRIGRLLMAKRRCLANSAMYTDTADVASPSKLRVCDLRLNSRDSEKDFITNPTNVPTSTTSSAPSVTFSSTTTASTTGTPLQRFRTIQPPSSLLMKVNRTSAGNRTLTTQRQISSTPSSTTSSPLPSPMDETGSTASTPTSCDIPTTTQTSDSIQSTHLLMGYLENISTASQSVATASNTTTITGNVSNIPCPAGVDTTVFNELPLDVQNELIESWRSSLAAAAVAVANGNIRSTSTTIASGTTHTNQSANAVTAKAGGAATNGSGAQKNTLYRYFLRNKLPLMQNDQECRNFIVKLTRLRFDKYSKIYTPTKQNNVALQEQCTTNSFPGSSEKQLQIPTAFKKAVSNRKRCDHKSTTEPVLNNLPKGFDISYTWCKPLRVRVKRINAVTHQIEKAEREIVQNMRRTKKDEELKTRHTMKKGMHMKTPKESSSFSKVIAANHQILKENMGLANVVLTPHLRKRLNKLSLSKCSSDRTKIDNSFTKNHSRFSLVRNSVISDDKHKEDLSHTNSKERRSLKTAINDPDLIEELICSNDSEEGHDNTIQVKKPKTTHKFFHRVPEGKVRLRKKCAKPQNIFDFLSESDTSESEVAKHGDPAADVIKKLISEGKVRVATNQKGTGRPILKRGILKAGRKKREVNKNKTCKEKRNKTNNAVNNKPSKISETLDNYDVGATLPPPSGLEDQYVSMANYDQQQNILTNIVPGTDEHVRDEGFSRLARSVLLQETRKVENTYKKNFTEQRRLLDAARKFVSTPAANRQSRDLPTSDLSPIKFPSLQNRPVCPSPWRINDDSHLPSIFNFTKNTSCLPTFSSDYIPPTPKKNKSKDSQTCNDSNITPPMPITTRQANSSTVSRNRANSIPSGQLQNTPESENDSNVENMPPTALTVTNNDDNASIFNLRQLPNPRRTLGKRSPLKAINIIEVVSLPSWKKTVNDKVNKEAVSTVTGDVAKNDKSNEEDLFGFEEFLDPNSDGDGEPKKTDVKSLNRPSVNRNLCKKLKDLQKWRPENSTHNNKSVSTKTCDVFDSNGPKQRLINEMLCSTMIDNLNDGKTKGQQNNESLNDISICGNEKATQPPETDFFNDYEPEPTFQKKTTLRTYVRPAKRKRKTRKHFVMFKDSEETNSDSEEEELEHINEEPKKKRHEAHGNGKMNHEMESFVNEFNSMCKDVENYELLVE
ncbi:uncharacterized protein LOC126758088 [Bactrocera neohumeralis]|uniref:uncharacterized protein LOC126758088 n=1 Tax=Bactrocera neohumeralis TaxID=98809 RepID=UPI0021663AC9|nr:uncharacterized protein LOC126758088 [Bactrocera neohumeralis]